MIMVVLLIFDAAISIKDVPWTYGDPRTVVTCHVDAILGTGGSRRERQPSFLPELYGRDSLLFAEGKISRYTSDGDPSWSVIKDEANESAEGAESHVRPGRTPSHADCRLTHQRCFSENHT